MNDDSKPIWQSRTVLASIASLLAGLFMLFGIEVNQDELTEALVLVSGLVTTIMSLVAIWGRIRARKRIAPLTPPPQPGA